MHKHAPHGRPVLAVAQLHETKRVQMAEVGFLLDAKGKGTGEGTMHRQDLPCRVCSIPAVTATSVRESNATHPKNSLPRTCTRAYSQSTVSKPAASARPDMAWVLKK